MEQDLTDSQTKPTEKRVAGIDLIQFNRKVYTYIGVCLFLYLFFVICKLHNSSIPEWNANIIDGAGADRGIVAGKSLAIRSDEWLVVSPFILSQEKNNFPVTSEALGYGKIPLVMGLPSNHILSKLRPALWGYYFLDGERAFSWQWNFRIFPFLIVSFLFLLLFTNNNFNVSLIGSIWLFLSSSVQWWSINTEIFTFAFSLIISFIYLLYSRKTKIIIINGLIFLIAAYSFAMVLYPAYQVPLAYFIIALLAGFFIQKKGWSIILIKKVVKLSVLGSSLILLSLLFYLFYKECKDTIDAMTHTVYPGRRVETGGNFPFISMFKDNFSWFLSNAYYPGRWNNICELSSFLMLSPIASLLIIISWLKTRKVNMLFIPLLCFQLFIYLWFLKGFPESFSKLTLLSTSPTPRTFFVFGFSNVVFSLLYLGQFKRVEEKNGSTFIKAFIFAVIFIAAFIINYLLNKDTDRFFSIFQIVNAAILFAILNWLVVYFSEAKRFQQLFFACVLLFCGANIFVNPLSRGLSPFYENKIYKTVSEIEEKDPEAGWVEFGNMLAADFLKAAGINCFNGVQFIPPIEKLHVLDPSLKNDDIYDRYAHITFNPMIDGRDSVKFTLNFLDNYSIQMDPCSPRLKQIGIKYFLFSYKPSEPEIRCMIPVKDTLGYYIFKRRDL